MEMSYRIWFRYSAFICWIYLFYLTLDCILNGHDVTTKITDKDDGYSESPHRYTIPEETPTEWDSKRGSRHHRTQTERSNALLITGYLGGGVDVIWNLIVHKPGIFYTKEPLQDLDKLVYDKSKDICLIVNDTCRSWNGIDELATTLINIFRCDFSYTRRIKDNTLHITHGSASLPPDNDICKANMSQCLRILKNVCLNSTMPTAMVSDLPVDVLDIVMRKLLNLNVVHVWRDPRAIIHTRMQTVKERFKDISFIADTLCWKMRKDLEVLKLAKLYQPKIQITRYEDFALSPTGWMKNMNNNQGYTLTDREVVEMLQISESRENMSAEQTKEIAELYSDANAWRRDMTWEDLQEINRLCLDVIMLLKYQTIDEEEVLRDLKFDSTYG